MQGLEQFWSQSDPVGRAVAVVLLAMSVSAWAVIVWKAWTLRQAAADLPRAMRAFWDAPSLTEGRLRLLPLDRQRLVLPLVDAAMVGRAAGTLACAGDPVAQATRTLRDALHRALAPLHQGQVLLASIGSTAPFVGLFGTVWGVHHALAGIAGDGGMTLEKVSGPIGEALVMTAAGIAVAVPAVLAYNIFGKRVADCEAELEGFAHDLRGLRLDAPADEP